MFNVLKYPTQQQFVTSQKQYLVSETNNLKHNHINDSTIALNI